MYKRNFCQCIGQEFAFNETAYFLVKLLQRFKGFRLATEYQPEGSLPNPAWKGQPGRQSIEKIAPSIGMTVYSKVSLFFHTYCDFMTILIGWVMDFH